MKFLRGLAINLLVLAAAATVFALGAEGVVRVLSLDKEGVEDWGTRASILRNSADPDIGLELVPGAKGKIIGIDVSISKAGIRDRDFPKEKTPGVNRVMVIGDSITFGYGVKRDDAYPKVLERALNEKEPGKWEVINFGTPGVNITEYVSMFLKRGAEYKPDLVIVGYCLNDVDPPARNMPNRLAEGTTDIEYHRNKKKARLLKEGKNLMRWEIPISAATEKTLNEHSALYRLVSRRWDVLLNKYGIRNNNPVISIDDTFTSQKRYFDEVAARYDGEMWGVAQKEFEKLLTYTSQHGIKLIVAVFPFLIDVDGKYPYWRLHEKIGQFLISKGDPPLDIKLIFDREKLENKNLWVGGFDMIHFTPPGHMAVAEALRDRIFELRK